jgi:hypothetical protein
MNNCAYGKADLSDKDFDNLTGALSLMTGPTKRAAIYP